ncbi:plasmid pRiA4b ORF-3 family protein [Streptomyces canus]|uniref:IS1096 element passenger TnpR family protein n=1 Tax=Streptomyces canus TaxID=58343 RepID=UPI0032450FD6
MPWSQFWSHFISDFYDILPRCGDVTPSRRPVAIPVGLHSASAGPRHPHCVDGAGACPPEDCGGGPGYSDLKVILADPAPEEHHAMLVWLGLRSATEFAPDRFAPDEANARLLRLTAP